MCSSDLSLPERAVDDLRSIAISIVRGEESVEIQAATREEANVIIDKVRAAGGFVEGMSASSSSLEEVFIRTTRPEVGNVAA